MIKTPVTYDAASQAIINKFDGCDPDYWQSPEVTPVRTLIKQHYLSQQKNECCYCKHYTQSKHGRIWDVEHIVPKSTCPQFMFEPQNLAVACIACNMTKYNEPVTRNALSKSLPREPDQYLLVHPHLDTMSAHIYIVPGRMYVPFTKKGSYTFHICGHQRYNAEFLGSDPVVAEDDELVEWYERFMEANTTASKDACRLELMLMMRRYEDARFSRRKV